MGCRLPKLSLAWRGSGILRVQRIRPLASAGFPGSSRFQVHSPDLLTSEGLFPDDSLEVSVPLKAWELLSLSCSSGESVLSSLCPFPLAPHYILPHCSEVPPVHLGVMVTTSIW